MKVDLTVTPGRTFFIFLMSSRFSFPDPKRPILLRTASFACCSGMSRYRHILSLEAISLNSSSVMCSGYA